MTHADFHAAILDEPDDDLTRLVFADWLDDCGEGDRAEFVRLGVRWDRAMASPRGSVAHADGAGLGRATMAAFGRAWPALYRVPRAVTLGTQFGLAILSGSVGNRSERIELPWLPDAVARGWVGPVRLAGTPRDWLRVDCPGLPLDVTALSHFGQNIVSILSYPDLIALAIETGDLTAAVARRLATCHRLRTVTLYGSNAARVVRELDKLRAVPKLRRINLHAPLTDRFAVSAFPALTRLVLFRNELTDPGVRRFSETNPTVSIGLPT